MNDRGSESSVEKLGLVMNLEVHRTGRRTYVNLPDQDVNICRIRPGDTLKVKIIEIRRQEEGGIQP